MSKRAPHPDPTAVLERILKPVAEEIAQIREATGGIVVVVHKPMALARKAFKTLKIKLRPAGETSVFGFDCANAVAALGHDLITRRWCSEPPQHDEIKVFLCAGDGTALLTMKVNDGAVLIKKEPDIYPVPPR